MTTEQLEYCRKRVLADPAAFAAGARSLCKSAALVNDISDLWGRVKPWLIALALGYGGLRLGSAWGRHAEKTKNPHGPIKGPLSEITKSVVEANLPGQTVYFPGQPGYDEALARKNELSDTVPGRTKRTW